MTWPLGYVCGDGSPPLMADGADDNDIQTSQVCGTTSWTDWKVLRGFPLFFWTFFPRSLLV